MSRAHLLFKNLAGSAARNADLLLLISGIFVKAFYVARAGQMATRWGHFSNLLLLLVVGSLALFLPIRWRKWTLAFSAALATLLLSADTLHHRVFREMVSAHQLAYVNQIFDVRSSIGPLLKWSDLVFLVDAPLWVVVLVWRRQSAPSVPGRIRGLAKTGAAASCLGFYGWNLHMFLESPVAKNVYATRRGESYIPVAQRGILSYHVLDTFFFIRDHFAHEHAAATEIQAVEKWFRDKDESGAELLPFGVARGKNLIVIQVESLQAFAIGLRIEGQPVTPNLNQLSAEAHYFTRFFSQASAGTTSDAEFCMLNSLMPSSQGAVVFRYRSNTFNALPAILARANYHSLAMHILPGTFWNIRQMHSAYGFQEGHYADALVHRDEDPWLVPDEQFFDRTLPLIKNAPRPFFAHLLTMTSHTPFKQLPPNRRTLNVGKLKGTLLGDYFQSAHYVDWVLGNFFRELKAAGLYDDSLIVIYGDHEGLPPAALAGAGEYEGQKVDENLRGRVPLFLIIPGVQGGSTITDPAGQIDISPTVLHLLGITDPSATFLGRNLLRTDPEPFVFFRTGFFLTRSYSFQTRAGDFESGITTPLGTDAPADREAAARRYQEVQTRLMISDRILHDDLIPRLMKR